MVVVVGMSLLQILLHEYIFSSQKLHCSKIAWAQMMFILKKDLIVDGPTPGPGENNSVRKLLLEDTGKLEARFQDDAQVYFFGTEEPTAADIGAYTILERLVGDSGDCQMGGATPWLFEKVHAPRLKAWHARMRERYPIKIFGKDKEAKVWTEKQSALRQ